MRPEVAGKMNQRSKEILWMLLAVTAAAVTWTYMHRVLLPWEYYVNVSNGRLRAQMGDLYPRWVGTRQLLLNGKNPYGIEVSHEIQMGFYGHPIEQSYDLPESKIIDEQRFAYPVYVVFLLAPTVHMEFEHLDAWAPIILAALTVISIWLWLEVARWRMPLALLLSMAVLFTCSPQIAQGLRLRQLALLIGFLLALASWCVGREKLFVAGLVLSLATIKPQMVSLCLLWFPIWSLGDWKKRWQLVAGFSAGLGAFVVGGWILLPGWPRYFLQGLVAYHKYYPTTSPLRAVLGDWIGGAVTLVLVAILFSVAWHRRQSEGNSEEFAVVLASFLMASCLVMPIIAPYNHVLLILPAILIFRNWDALPRWGRGFLGVLITWPWLVSAVLLVHPPPVDSFGHMPLLPSVLMLSFPFIVPLAALVVGKNMRAARALG